MSATGRRILPHKSIINWQLQSHRCRFNISNSQRCINYQREQRKEQHDTKKDGTKQKSNTINENGLPKLSHTEAAAKTKWSLEDVNTVSTAIETTNKTKLSSQQMRQNVEGYMFSRVFDSVKNYDKVLEKNFPSAVKVYRVFFDGVLKFYQDMKHFLKISRIVYAAPDGLKSLNRKELELYMRMPSDLIKVAPALIGSSLPIIGYVIFPIVYMYPRKFLTSHFWSVQQRTQFQELDLRDRLRTNREVLRQLQSKLSAIEFHEKHDELKTLLGLLGSGFHPSVNAILNVKDLFRQPPYTLSTLSNKHLKVLTQMHGISSGLFKKARLEEHAFLVHHMDLAIKREGDVHNLPSYALRYSCYIRGLNHVDLSDDDMVEWLKNWIEISTTIQSEHISLFLHLPIFLAYNHPNNLQLIYERKTK